MESYEVDILIKYLSAWNWHLTGMIFFVGAIISAVMRDLIFFAVLLGGFLIAEILAAKRKNEIYKEEHEEIEQQDE